VNGRIERTPASGHDWGVSQAVDKDAHKSRVRRVAEGLLAWALLVAWAWWVIAEGVTR
jgi:hypothetical protein